MFVDCTDYRDIFLNDRPMMDARAPVEFNKGAFPGVINLPLMNDHERQRVGTCYKQHGQQAAIVLGHQLVSGAVKAERIQAWADFARAHPDGCCIAFAAACARRSSSNGSRTRPASTIHGWAAATRPCAPSCWTPSIKP